MAVIDLANEMEQLSSSSDSDSISPLVDSDGVCNIHDDFFQMFFANKS